MSAQPKARTVEVTLKDDRVVRVTGYLRLCYESFESFYLDDAELVTERVVDAATGAEIEDADTLIEAEDRAFEALNEPDPDEGDDADGAE